MRLKECRTIIEKGEVFESGKAMLFEKKPWYMITLVERFRFALLCHEFSKVAFYYALKKNQYYRIANEDQCLKDLGSFKVKVGKADKSIEIIDRNPWKISSGRRKKIGSIYQDFSAERVYGRLNAVLIFTSILNLHQVLDRP